MSGALKNIFQQNVNSGDNEITSLTTPTVLLLKYSDCKSINEGPGIEN